MSLQDNRKPNSFVHLFVHSVNICPEQEVETSQFAIWETSLNLYGTKLLLCKKSPVLDFPNASHLFSTAPSFPKLLSFPASNLSNIGAEHLAASRTLCWASECQGTRGAGTQGSEPGSNVPGALSPQRWRKVGNIPGAKEGREDWLNFFSFGKLRELWGKKLLEKRRWENLPNMLSSCSFCVRISKWLQRSRKDGSTHPAWRGVSFWFIGRM